MASVAIGALRVDLSLGTAEFEEGAKKAQKKAKKAAGGIQKAFGGLGKIFTPFNLGVASAVASMTAFGAAIRGNISDFDKLIKTSRQIGLPVEQFSALTFAAGQSGISVDELGRGFRNLARNVAGGSTQFRDALQALGIDVENFAGLDQQERLLLLADKFSVLRESGNKTALAMRILGEEMGPRFINLLNNGRAGLTDYIAEASRLGVTIDKDTAEASERFNDDLERLGLKASAVARNLTAKMLPALESIADVMLKIGEIDFGAEIDKIDKAVGDKIVNSLNQVGRAFQQLAIQILQGEEALKKFNDQQRRQAMIAQQVSNTAAKGDLELGAPVPKTTPGPGLQDAPVLPGASAATEARKAEAQAARELLVAETALNQLRMEFASPEQQRILRLEELRQKLSGLKDGTIEAAEASKLYEQAARSMQANVVSAYANIASSVAGSLGGIFTKSKGFAIAQALIDTYAAFNSALANPPGPPFSYAQAGAALASGIARVNAIRSTNPGSGGGAAVGGGAAAGNSGQTVQAAPRQAVNLTLHGQTFGRDMVRNLMMTMNDLIADGAVLNVRSA